MNILPQFLQHCFAKREQAASYQYQRGTAIFDSTSSGLHLPGTGYNPQ